MSHSLTNEEIVAKADMPKKSIPYLLRFEYTKILSNRYQQLQDNAEPLIQMEKGQSLLDIAKMEIQYKILPVYVIRPHEDGQDFDVFRLKDLTIPDSLIQV